LLPPLSVSGLCFYHLFVAVHTHNAYLLCGSTTASADRTAIFSVMGVRCCANGLQSVAVSGVRSYADRYKRGIRPAHFNLPQFVMRKQEVNQGICGFGVAVAVLFGAGDNQTMCFCFTFEYLIMVYTFIRCVLFVSYAIVIHMYHFVYKACNNVFKRSVKCSAGYVNLPFGCVLCAPNIKRNIMGVGSRRGYFFYDMYR